MVNLVILNITSWTGVSPDAHHVYGRLILCENPSVTVDNVEGFNIKFLGKNIELHQPLTMEAAIKLDKKDGGKNYQDEVELMEEYPGRFDHMECWGKTNRFDTFEEVENFAITEWRKLNLGCPFISLYEDSKYDIDYNGKKGKTKILFE